MAKMSGGEALVKSLVREGVEVVFGLPGIQIYGIVAAIRDEPGIRMVTTRHCNATTKSVASGGTGKLPTARRCRPPLGGDATGPDPTNRGKLGTKRHVLSDRRGLPLGVVVSAANRHDMQVAAATLASVVVDRPVPTTATPQHLYRDKGFDYPETRAAATAQGLHGAYPVARLGYPTPTRGPALSGAALGRGAHQ